MMQRYFNMPPKKTLAVVCIILAFSAFSNDCIRAQKRVDDRTEEDYKGYKITKTDFEMDQPVLVHVFQANYKIEEITFNVGEKEIKITKTFTPQGDVEKIDQKINGQTKTYDLKSKGDPLPGFKAAERIIDNLSATTTPTVTPTPVPDIEEITPSSGGDHSHIEGEQATEYPIPFEGAPYYVH